MRSTYSYSAREVYAQFIMRLLKATTKEEAENSKKEYIEYLNSKIVDKSKKEFSLFNGKETWE